MAGIGAVILAAGASARMSIPKQLLQFRGQAFLRRAASVALEAGCRPVVVVTGANVAACRESLRGLDVLEAENQQWEFGISSSVRVGIEALVTPNPRIAAVVLMLCDQPFVTRDVIVGLVRAHYETGCSIVASRYGGSYGVPALFGKAATSRSRRRSSAAAWSTSPTRTASSRRTISRGCNRRIIPTRPKYRLELTRIFRWPGEIYAR